MVFKVSMGYYRHVTYRLYSLEGLGFFKASSDFLLPFNLIDLHMDSITSFLCDLFLGPFYGTESSSLLTKLILHILSSKTTSTFSSWRHFSPLYSTLIKSTTKCYSAFAGSIS